MITSEVSASEDYDQVIGSIQKNFHLIEGSGNFYKFNNRVLLSNCSEFLNAVKSDIGGELIVDSSIGSFLYFGDENQD